MGRAPDSPSSGQSRPPGGPDEAHAESARAAEALGGLRIVLLLVWALASFGLMYFAQDLQKLAGSWPFSFWLGAQGIVLVFVLIVGVYAFVANRMERRLLSGLSEDGRS